MPPRVEGVVQHLHFQFLYVCSKLILPTRSCSCCYLVNSVHEYFTGTDSHL